MSFDRFNGKWQNPQCLKKKSWKSKKPQNVCLKHNEFSTSVTWIRNKNKTITKKKKKKKKLWKIWTSKKNHQIFVKQTMTKSFFKVHNVTWREKITLSILWPLKISVKNFLKICESLFTINPNQANLLSFWREMKF